MVLAKRLFVNHFAPDEQGPVGRAIDANSSAIAAELGITTVEDVAVVDDFDDDEQD
jgi:hypothetical protein